MHNQVKNVTESAKPGIAAEMRAIVRGACEPWQPGDSVKAAIARAARRLGMEFSRARVAWYGRPAAWLAHEVDALRARQAELLHERSRRLQGELDHLQAMISAQSDTARSDTTNRGATAR